MCVLLLVVVSEEEKEWKADIVSLLDERDRDLFVSEDSIEIRDGWDAAMRSVNKRLQSGLRAYKDFYGIPEFDGVPKSRLPQLMMIPYETQVKVESSYIWPVTVNTVVVMWKSHSKRKAISIGIGFRLCL